MQEINVKEIMDEIKNEIKVQGYTNDLLSFDDVTIEVGDMNVPKFDKVKFNEEIYDMNQNWEVQAYRPIQGNPIAVFIKKVIRRLVYFFVEPIVLAQDGFNASQVRAMNQLNCYIDEQTKEIEELKRQIKELKGEN